MTDAIRCFWLQPTDQVELSLRRYRGGDRDKCEVSGFGYHNVSVIVERTSIAQLAARGWPMRDDRPVYLTKAEIFGLIPKDDPRWPRSCSCGYRFADGDKRQFNPAALFRRSDNDELVTLAAAPAGAMWNAEWNALQGPDGISLMVRTPGGEWPVDGPSYEGGKVKRRRGWSRSGAIPDVTVNPSILIPGKYQGFLRMGWLQSI
jgi:hypothetical protein